MYSLTSLSKLGTMVSVAYILLDTSKLVLCVYPLKIYLDNMLNYYTVSYHVHNNIQCAEIWCYDSGHVAQQNKPKSGHFIGQCYCSVNYQFLAGMYIKPT